MTKLTALTLAGLAALVLTAAPMAAYAEDSQPQPKGGTLKGAAVGAVAGHHEKAKSEDRINSGQQP